MTQNIVYAVYRVLYGEDFIQESIKSILNYVDEVFVCIADKPFGNTQGVTYKGEWIPWPQKFDDVREKVLELNDPKIKIIDDYCPTPLNQLTHIVNDLILPHHERPNIIVMMEPDHVFCSSEIRDCLEEFATGNMSCATTEQIELWKEPSWRIPSRPNRVGPVLHKLNVNEQFCQTGFNGAPIGFDYKKLYATVHNMGFCISPKVMYWKHLASLAFSQIIGDSIPNETWYEDKWLKWNPQTNNSDLEISRGFEYTIPCAYPYDLKQLPEFIKEKYGIQQ